MGIMNFEQWAELQTNCQYKEKRDKVLFCTKLNANCSFNRCSLKDAHPLISHGVLHHPTQTEYSRGVASLTQKQQEAIRLANQGLKTKEIAIAMGCTRQAVEKHLNRGKILLGVANDGLRVASKRRVVAHKHTLEVAYPIRLHDDNISFEIEETDLEELWGSQRTI